MTDYDRTTGVLEIDALIARQCILERHRGALSGGHTATATMVSTAINDCDINRRSLNIAIAKAIITREVNILRQISDSFNRIGV